MIRGTKLDTGSYLDKIKKLSPNDQHAAAKRDLASNAPPRGGIAARYGSGATCAPKPDLFESIVRIADACDEMDAKGIIAASGRQRSVLGQRAAGIAKLMDSILEGLG